MTQVVSVQFRGRGKSYYFDPAGIEAKRGDLLVVETSKGLELGECTQGNHAVDDGAVVQPLRPVVRIATADDRRVADINRRREKEALGIAEEKILKHGLEMKLVDVECSFEGNKILFFFTADGRVDFRELVKDLAGVFRTRIELRQIGVRDEAKMLGGIGICGQPFCCSRFLTDFQPVSTKMAKTQSMSLNPAKISGCCGRLMCCLRYEQEAYEELIKKVPKQGAFVETKDGYGTAVQVNLLRQTVKVKLDDDSDDTLRLFKANELCAVPGGRPKDGEAPPSVLVYVPEEEEEVEEIVDPWAIPFVEEPVVVEEPEAEPAPKSRRSRSRRSRSGKGAEQAKAGHESVKATEKAAEKKAEKSGEQPKKEKPEHRRSNKKPNTTQKKSSVKPVKVEAKVQAAPAEKPEKIRAEAPARENTGKDAAKNKNNRRRRYYHGKPKAKTGGSGANSQ